MSINEADVGGGRGEMLRRIPIFRVVRMKLWSRIFNPNQTLEPVK